MTHEAADALDISRQRVLALAKAGRLGRKVEGRLPYYLFTAEEIEAYKQRPRKPGRPKAERPTPSAPPSAPPEGTDPINAWMRRGRSLSGKPQNDANDNLVDDK